MKLETEKNICLEFICLISKKYGTNIRNLMMIYNRNVISITMLQFYDKTVSRG